MRYFFSFLFIMLGSLSSLNCQNVSESYFDGQIYFKLKDGVELPRKYLDDKASVNDFNFMRETIKQFGVTQIRASFYFAKDPSIRRIFRVYFSRAEEIQVLINYLKAQPEVEYAEPVPLHRKSLTPNDLGANNTGSSGQWALHKIRAQFAWDISLGNNAIKVAVVDDAVQTTHPDLTNVCVAGRDVSDNDNNPNPPNTTYDHGTHVAGIVGAQTNNGTGIASIGFGISIIPIKATNDPEFITDGYEGVVWAINNGADVINMSWGGSGGSQTGQNIMNNGNNAGVVLVAAAGNDNVSTTFFPAGFNFVISVASTSTSDAKSSFSNFGSWIDISAPGSSIRSTVPTTGYSSKSGTSMASPLVAGLCGLMLSSNPLLSPQDVLECLQLSADNINAQNGSFIGQLGAGRINAESAMQCASASAVAFDASVISILSPSGSSCSTSFSPQISIRNTGQSTITSLALTIQIDNQTTTNFTWTGNLSSQSTSVVTLPTLTSTIGNHTLTICSSTINGSQTDGFTGNNCKTIPFSIVSPIGINLPFIETFESGSFATNGWTVSNPDNGLGWEIITSAGTVPGTRSARIPFYSYSAVGARDGIITPTLNFAQYSNISLSFDHAYRRYNSGSTDSLIVSISTDCGETYPTRILIGGENGQGSFATASISTTDFIPATSNDWCYGPIGSDCIQLNLNTFSGSSGVRIKFEGFNNYGNNLYIDNININGVISGAAAIADFVVAGNTTVCAENEVLFTNLSANQPNNYQWTFPGGSPSSSSETNPTITYNQPGVYQVSLQATNTFGTDIETKVSYITIEANPALSISANPSEICKGTPTTLTGFGAETYEWSPVLAISSTTGESILANPPQTTTYNLTGTSASGCSSTIEYTLIVNDLPTQPTIETIDGGLLSSSEALNYQWYLNDVLIIGANQQTYQPSANGNYKVRITNEIGCSSFSNSAVYEFEVGIQDVSILSIDLLPNPNSGVFSIKGVTNFNFSVFSSNGQLIKQSFSADGVIQFNDLADGLYFIQIVNNKTSITKPFVIAASE